MNRFLCVLCSMVVLIVSACENKSAAVITHSDNETVQSSVNTKPSLIAAFKEGLKQDAVLKDPKWEIDKWSTTHEQCLQIKKDQAISIREAAKEDIETIRQLIKDGADVNEMNYMDMPVLAVALNKGYDSSIINLLIDSGADMHHVSEDDHVTMLMRAAYDSDNLKLIQPFIQSGIDVNAKNNNGITALMYAVSGNSNPAIIRELVKAGADVTARDNEGLTILHHAVVDNHTESSRDVLIEVLKQIKNKYIVQNGRKVPLIDVKTSYFESTALMGAAGNCMRQRYALLLRHGANPNLKDKDGRTAKEDLDAMIEHDAESCHSADYPGFW